MINFVVPAITALLLIILAYHIDFQYREDVPYVRLILVLLAVAQTMAFVSHMVDALK